MPAARSLRAPSTAAAAAWTAFLAAVIAGGPLYDVSDAESLAVAAVMGAGLIIVGVAAAARCRPLPPRGAAEHARSAALVLALGIGLGLANFGANTAMAAASPDVDRLLTERIAELARLPWAAFAGVPVVEEVALRLFFMSALAWVASRFIKRPQTVFLAALCGSALAFGLLHLDRAYPPDPTAALLYGAGVVFKSGLASLLLGWVFWRRGLPFSILCHLAANTTHRLLEPLLF